MNGNYSTELVQVAAVALAAAQCSAVDTTAMDLGTLEGAAGLSALHTLTFRVRKERERQELKFGTRTQRDAPPEFWLVVLLEEVGEVADEILKSGKPLEPYYDSSVRHASALGDRARAALEAKCRTPTANSSSPP